MLTDHDQTFDLKFQIRAGSKSDRLVNPVTMRELMESIDMGFISFNFMCIKHLYPTDYRQGKSGLFGRSEIA